MTSVEVVAGDDILASEYNVLRDDVLVNAGDYATAGGTGNAITLTVSSDIPTYADGQVYKFKAAAANTGATTLAVNGQAAKNILKDHDVALEANDIENGQLVIVQYDGTQFQMLSQKGVDLASSAKTTLGAGATSNADALHTHRQDAQDAASFAAGLIHLPVYLDYSSVVLTGANFGTIRGWELPGSFGFTMGNVNAAAAVRSDGTDDIAGGTGTDGIFYDSSTSAPNLGTTWTATFKIRFGVVPASTDTFFLGFDEDADTHDATFASPTTSRHCGIEWNGTNWRITNGSSTTQTTTNISAPSTGWHEFKMVRTSGTSIAFYLDGTLLGTHTTNLPTAGALVFYLALDNNSGTTRVIELSRCIDMYVATT